MRTPKKGEVVIYFPNHNEDDALSSPVTGGLPAIVLHAWNEHSVNLRVFTDSDEDPLWRTSVEKLNEPELDQMKEVYGGHHMATSFDRRGWIFQD